MKVKQDDFHKITSKNENNRAGRWRVYKRYFCHPTVDASGKASERYLYAPPSYEEGESEEVINNAVDRYAPLHIDQLFLEFARLVENPGMDVADLTEDPATSLRTDGLEAMVELPAGLDSEHNREVAVGWVEGYGVLGLTPRRKPGSVGGDPRGGEGDTVKRFAYEAWAANVTLRLYEACTAPEGPELDVILRQLPYLEGRRGPEAIRNEALESVRKQVRIRLQRHTYVQLGSGGYGFHSLLGAMWLQMSWLFDDAVEGRRCKWCGKVIAIEPGQPPPDPGSAKNVRGRYKTRKDKAFCNDPQDKTKSTCRVKYNYYAKKRGTSDWRSCLSQDTGKILSFSLPC